MRSLSLAHWIFHALCCFAVGLISHNAYQSKSLDPPRQNALVCAVSQVTHSQVAHSVVGWAEQMLDSMAHSLTPYRAPAPTPRAHPHLRIVRRH